MSAMASQITGNSTICLTAVSNWHQRKHHSSTLLALCHPELHHNHMLPDNITVTVTFHECHGISNHWQLNYLFNSGFQLTSKKTSQLHITGPMSSKTTGDQWISLTRWRKSLAIPMFVQHLVKLVSKETSKLCITGLVWGEPTSHWWIPLTGVL